MLPLFLYSRVDPSAPWLSLALALLQFHVLPAWAVVALETYWGTSAAATTQAAQVPSGGQAVPWQEPPQALGSQNTTQAEPKQLNSN